MSETLIQEEFGTRCQKVRQFAQNLFQRGPDWVTFFREVLGISGAARKVFPSQDEFVAFEKTEEYGAIQQMVNSLRTRKGNGLVQHEPTRVITVRLPESLHEALKAEANDHNTSMNKLCISKLLQVLVDEEQSGAPSAVVAPQALRLPATTPSSLPSSHSMPVRAPVASLTTPGGTTFTPRFSSERTF